jgi:fatty acid desaturase
MPTSSSCSTPCRRRRTDLRWSGAKGGRDTGDAAPDGLGVVALLAAAWGVLGVLGTLWGAVADGRWWSVPVAVPWLVACYWVSVGALRRALTA